jgi:MFS family permease
LYQRYNVLDAILANILGLCYSSLHICHRYISIHSGAIAISVIPLLADYVSHQSRGTSAAFLVFMSSLGALASAFINFSLLSQISESKKIYVQYGVISILILVIGLGYSLICLKKGN